MLETMESTMEAAGTHADGNLLSFIERHHDEILQQWEQFAKTIPAAGNFGVAALRDHALGMLQTIEADLRVSQTPLEQSEKARGRAPPLAYDTQATLHGAERVLAGFSVTDVVAEFRALRASVVQLWNNDQPGASTTASAELNRFHEAIDQSLAESIKRFALDKEEYTRRFDTLLSSSPDLHYIFDIDGALLYANEALRRLFAVPQEHIIGMRLNDLCPDHAARIAAELHRVIETATTVRAELKLTLSNGVAVTYRYVLMPVLNSMGHIDAITGTARNISELKASEEKIYRNAYYDSLTQLPNRALFRDRLEQHVKQATRSGHPFALLYIDLDGFKAVNDRSGHDAGDQLLKECARRIRACVRSTDTVARIGGDEFTIILSDIDDVLHIDILAQAILDALAQPFTVCEAVHFISGSMGITLFPLDGSTPDVLLGNADHAMYVAKQAGRNRLSFFTGAMRDSAGARLQTIEELRRALSLHQFEVYYQPIIDLASGAIVKAEALVRWHHPTRGLMLPERFIELAEQTGLIGEIDAWVLGDAVMHARRWTALLGRPFQVSVNKSPVDFSNTAMMQRWDSGLDAAGLGPDQIAVEITEGVLLNDSGAVRERLDLLRRAGVQFTIDDFGIGYSSLSYLKKFKVDFLKIDQLFVKDIMQSADSGIFAETIIIMAHKLGLKVIAEGVETTEQRDLLKAMHCDYGQGFLFSPPTSSARFSSMLESA